MATTSKPIPMTGDEACTWLTLALLDTAEVRGTTDGDLLIITRDDGAALRIKASGGGELSFEAEGTTI